MPGITCTLIIFFLQASLNRSEIFDFSSSEREGCEAGYLLEFCNKVIVSKVAEKSCKILKINWF